MVELLVASSVTTILMLALGGALHLMTRGAASLETTTQLCADAAVAVTRVRQDLGQALAVTELTPTRITISHPDITGDGLDDTVSYSWDGSTGSSLTRSVNGQNPVAMADGVADWAVTGYTNLRTLSGGAGTRQILLAHLGCPFPGFAGSCQPQSIGLASSTWRGELFRLDSSTSGTFAVNRIAIYLYRYPNGPLGTLYVRFRDFTAGTTLQEKTMPIGSIVASQWGCYEFAFENLGNLRFGRDYGICIGTNTISTAAFLGRFDYSAGAPADSMTYMESSDSYNWYMNGNIDLKFVVYGTIGTGSGASPSEYVTHFAMRLRLTDGTRSAVVDSGVDCPNRPAVVGF